MKPTFSNRTTALSLELLALRQSASTNQLAMLGGIPVRTRPYPEWPEINQRDIEAVTTVLRSRNWGGTPYPGSQTAEFARNFAAMQGGDFAVPMANGTVTLEVALRAAGIGWGDEVIIPTYTFQATATAPIAVGAIPVLVDIDPDTYCIDPAAVEAAITDHTRAIIPVHLGAQLADMDALMDIAERYDLVVIEDCAHAHGAKWRGKGAGTCGHFGSFSLQASKSLTTGEGGVLLCRTQELADRAAQIINWGVPAVSEEKSSFANPLLAKIAEFYHAPPSEVLGTNYRMTELQAALGNVALERFPQQLTQRESMMEYLEHKLSSVPGIRLLKRDLRQTRRSLYRYIFAIEPDVFGAEHDEVCFALYAEGIPCWHGYRALHRDRQFQPTKSRLPVPDAFSRYFNYDLTILPEAEKATESEAIWLDEAVFRDGQQGIDDVVAAIAKVQANAATLSAAKEQLLQTIRA